MTKITFSTVVFEDGSVEHYLNGQVHCEDGPAIVHPDGTCEWWLNDVRLTEEQYANRVVVKRMTVAEAEVALADFLGYPVQMD